MGILGTLAGGVGGFLLGGPAGAMSGATLGSNIDANEQRMATANAANDFSAAQYATRYQTTVKDMEAAGLNPALAYGGISGSSPSGVAAQVGSPAEGASSAYMAGLQSDLIKAQVENTQADSVKKRSEAELAQAQIGATGASADQSRASIAFMEQQGKKIMEEIKNIPKDGDRLVALVKNLSASSDLMAKQGLSAQAQAEQLKELARKTFNEADLTMLDVQAALKFDNFGREFQQYKPIIDLLKHLFPSRR